jgi:hypothetical protein
VLEIDSQDGDPLVFYRGRLNRVRELATSPTTL